MFRFSWKVTLVCGVLVSLMVRASFWQWSRHVEKKAYIEQMRSRLREPIVSVEQLLAAQAGKLAADRFTFKRVQIKGEYDFAHEMVLRNRKFGPYPGVHVLTPLRLDQTDQYILVDRGFIPLSLSSPAKRKPFQKQALQGFIGLAKDSVKKKFFAPSDPESGPGKAWVEAWLRVDLPAIERQLPYKILPFFVELIDPSDPGFDAGKAEEQIVQSDEGRDELFMLTSKSATLVTSADDIPKVEYPIPAYDTVIPAGRHYGYVYEWAAMALITSLIGVILQLRRPQRAR